MDKPPPRCHSIWLVLLGGSLVLAAWMPLLLTGHMSIICYGLDILGLALVFLARWMAKREREALKRWHAELVEESFAFAVSQVREERKADE